MAQGKITTEPLRQRKQREEWLDKAERTVAQWTLALEKRIWGVTGRAQSLAYWLIARNEHGRIEVLTLDGKKTLPVFSSEDEAEMFLRFDGVADGWQVSESRGGELISMLYGICTGVRKVALDPLPEMVADRTLGLVSLDRERFIRRLLARRRFCEPDRGSSPHEVERSSEAPLITVRHRAGSIA